MDGGVFDVVQGDGFDAGKDDVLGDFNAQSTHSRDQHVRFGHAPHGLLAENVELTRVQALVDVVGGDAIAVDGDSAIRSGHVGRGRVEPWMLFLIDGSDA